MGENFKEASKQCCEIANYAIVKYYEWELFRREEKKRTGRYPNKKDHRDKTYFYPELVKVYPSLSGNIVNQADRHAEKKWEAHKYEVMNREHSLPTFKRDFPITVHHKCYDITKQGNQYILSIRLLSEKISKDRTEVVLVVRDPSTRTILDRLISTEENNKSWGQGALQIVKKRSSWYCIISYHFEAEEEYKLDPEKIMGIDLGMTNAIYWAFNFSLKRGRIPGGEVEEFRKRIRARRISFQNQSKYSGDSRSGHGRKRKLEPTDKLREKEANFRNQINHRYAHHIVEVACKNNCGTIQMEDLSGITDNKGKFLKNWPYYDLQQKIIYKAEEKGIEVKRIPPAYTSQRCSQCGFIDTKNRPSRDWFVCQQCGYGDGKKYKCLDCYNIQESSKKCEQCGGEVRSEYISADYNAARNISIPDIDTVVKNTIQLQKEHREPQAN